MSVPHIWLPLNEHGGAVAHDYGTDTDWAVVDNSGTGWTDNPGFFTGNALKNFIWSDDPAVIAIMDMLSGATNGLDGRVLFVAYESIKAGTAGGFIQLGETGVNGWLLQRSTSNMAWSRAPDDSLQSIYSTTGDYSGSSSGHYAHLFDFKRGRVFNFIDGMFDFPNTSQHAAILAQADHSPVTVGVTLLVRNDAKSSTDRDNTANPCTHAIRKLYAADLTGVADPYAKVSKVARSFINSGSRLPDDVVNAW